MPTGPWPLVIQLTPDVYANIDCNPSTPKFYSFLIGVGGPLLPWPPEVVDGLNLFAQAWSQDCNGTIRLSNSVNVWFQEWLACAPAPLRRTRFPSGRLNRRSGR